MCHVSCVMCHVCHVSYFGFLAIWLFLGFPLILFTKRKYGPQYSPAIRIVMVRVRVTILYLCAQYSPAIEVIYTIAYNKEQHQQGNSYTQEKFRNRCYTFFKNIY